MSVTFFVKATVAKSNQGNLDSSRNDNNAIQWQKPDIKNRHAQQQQKKNNQLMKIRFFSLTILNLNTPLKYRLGGLEFKWIIAIFTPIVSNASCDFHS